MTTVVADCNGDTPAVGWQVTWLAGITDQITVALGQPTVSLIASCRGQFTQGKMFSCHGEGERRGWPLNEEECKGENPSWGLAWWEPSLAS